MSLKLTYIDRIAQILEYKRSKHIYPQSTSRRSCLSSDFEQQWQHRNDVHQQGRSVRYTVDRDNERYKQIYCQRPSNTLTRNLPL